LRSAFETWEAALGELQIQVSKPNFDTWLKDTKGVSLQDGIFVVGVPNAFVGEWLNGRLRSLIVKTLSGIIGKPADVRFEAKTQALPPLKESVLADGGVSVLERPAVISPVRREPAHVEVADLDRDSRPAFAPRLNQRFTFDTFVVGDSNRLAYSTALDIIENPSGYNPLYIHGSTGLGKTHLLQAIAHAGLSRRLRTVYMTAENFTNEFVAAVRARHAEEFRSRFQNLELFVLDDVQFLGGREQTQECLLHIFIDLYNSNCRIVIAGDRPPQQIALLDVRLQSRFAWGLVTSLRAPNRDTRLAIVQTRAALKGVPMNVEVATLLAETNNGNVRELEGLLNQVLARARLTGAVPDMTLIQDVLRETSSPPSDSRTSGNWMPDAIIEAVAAEFSVSRQALIGPNRDRNTTLARHVAMFIMQREGHYGINEIGRSLGNRDHSTVLHACRKIAPLAAADPEIQTRLKKIAGHLNPPVADHPPGSG
jgi:chromosomal replication initiator protein